MDILEGCRITPLDDPVDLSNTQKFIKLEPTQGQQMKINALMNQLPAIIGTDILSRTMVLHFPKGVNGVLMRLSNGEYTTTLVNPATSKFSGTASLQPLTSQALCLGAFTAMSVVSGQYFLSQINDSLAQISSGLDKLLEFLYGDKRAELLSEVSFIRFAHENYKSVMEHSEQRIATLINLQSAKKVAMKDIEFYLTDLSSTIMDKKNGDIPTTVPKMIRAKECLDLSLQLYTMSNLLEVYYSENYDPNYISFVQSEAFVYIEKCKNRSLTCFSRLQQLLSGIKEGFLNKINKIEYSQRIDSIVSELEAINNSSPQTALQTALGEITKEKQYYLSKNGEIHLKVS